MAESAIDNLPVGAKLWDFIKSWQAAPDSEVVRARGERAQRVALGPNVPQYQPVYASSPDGQPRAYSTNPNVDNAALVRRASDVPAEPWAMTYGNAPALPAALASPTSARAVQTPPPPGMEALPKVIYGNQPSGDARVDLVHQLRNAGLSFGMALDLLHASPPARAATASEFAGSRLLALAEGSLRQELENPKATDQTRAAARDRYMTVLTNMSGGLDPIKLAIAQKMGLQ